MKSPVILSIVVLAAILIAFLRPESVAQSTATVGGRYQLVAPEKEHFLIFDTATARTWQYLPRIDLPGGVTRETGWREISPSFATK